MEIGYVPVREECRRRLLRGLLPWRRRCLVYHLWRERFDLRGWRGLGLMTRMPLFGFGGCVTIKRFLQMYGKMIGTKQQSVTGWSIILVWCRQSQSPQTLDLIRTGFNCRHWYADRVCWTIRY